MPRILPDEVGTIGLAAASLVSRAQALVNLSPRRRLVAASVPQPRNDRRSIFAPSLFSNFHLGFPLDRRHTLRWFDGQNVFGRNYLPLGSLQTKFAASSVLPSPVY